MSEHTMEIKMSRFDNSPWGFRVHGGIDFGAPLRIQKVSTILAFLCAIKALALASRAYLVLYIRCGTVVTDFDWEAKTRWNF